MPAADDPTARRSRGAEARGWGSRGVRVRGPPGQSPRIPAMTSFGSVVGHVRAPRAAGAVAAHLPSTSPTKWPSGAAASASDVVIPDAGGDDQADGRAPATARRRPPRRWYRVRPAAPLDPDRRQRLEPLPAVRLRAPRLPLRPGAVAPSAPGRRNSPHPIASPAQARQLRPWPSNVDRPYATPFAGGGPLYPSRCPTGGGRTAP